MTHRVIQIHHLQVMVEAAVVGSLVAVGTHLLHLSVAAVAAAVAVGGVPPLLSRKLMTLICLG